jgi:hypothetical protein
MAILDDFVETMQGSQLVFSWIAIEHQLVHERQDQPKGPLAFLAPLSEEQSKDYVLVPIIQDPVAAKFGQYYGSMTNVNPGQFVLRNQTHRYL